MPRTRRNGPRPFQGGSLSIREGNRHYHTRSAIQLACCTWPTSFTNAILPPTQFRHPPCPSTAHIPFLSARPPPRNSKRGISHTCPLVCRERIMVWLSCGCHLASCFFRVSAGNRGGERAAWGWFACPKNRPEGMETLVAGIPHDAEGGDMNHGCDFGMGTRYGRS